MPLWTPPAAPRVTSIAVNGAIAASPRARLVSDAQLLGEYELLGGRVTSAVAIPRIRAGDLIANSQPGDLFVVDNELVIETGDQNLKVIVRDTTTAQSASSAVSQSKSVSSSPGSQASSSEGGISGVTEAAPTQAIEESFVADPTNQAFYQEAPELTIVTSQSGNEYSVLNPPPAGTYDPITQQAVEDAAEQALGLGQPEEDTSWYDYFYQSTGGGFGF